MANQTVEPLRNKKDIEKIEKYLMNTNERDYVVWVLGLNSGLRISDIIALDVKDVINKTHISIIEKKTQKTKVFYINNKLKCVLENYVKDKEPDEPLFLGKQNRRLNRHQVYRFIKNACAVNKINIHAGTHTMRKSFGYHHYQQFKDIVILQKIFNHSSARVTLIYIGIEQENIDESYRNFEL